MQSPFVYKLTRFEFWPWYALYLPLLPLYIGGVLYTRRLLYFTAVNPAIDMGGFFGERKDDIQSILPATYLVKSIIFKNGELSGIEEEMKRHGIWFPAIAKPIVGERGNGVKKIANLDELREYATQEPDFILQEYIDFSIELGILFYKLPNSGEVKVTSLAQKRYLSVIGNGVDSVAKLLAKDERNRLYVTLVEKEFPHMLNVVPKNLEVCIVHTIGNHIKGTQFVNANSWLSDKLDKTMSEIVSTISGVYYGRFDLKVTSFEDLIQGKNIKIFELNGVSAEPAHIYGLSNVLLAYRDLAYHWLLLIKIAKQNIKKGVKTTPLTYFLKQVRNHFG